MNSVMKTLTRTRGAFDIGSGTIKLQIGSFDANNKISSLLYGTERPVLFGEDWQKSKDGNLSSDIQERGIRVLGDLKRYAMEEHGVIEFYGVATEVFRKSPNGVAYLERVTRELEIPTVVVSQGMEAAIGYATGLAAIRVTETERDVDVNTSLSKLIIWDSGAASFQMTSMDPCSECSESAQFLMYMAPFGTSVVNSLLRGIKSESVPTEGPAAPAGLNPVSAKDIRQLVESLTSSLPSEVPHWLQAGSGLDCSVGSGGEETAAGPQIMAIGGRNSMFQTAKRILEVEGRAEGSDAFIPFTLHLNDLERCLSLCTDKTNDELLKYCDYEHSDGPGSTVSKLCLFYSVMKHLNLNAISTVCTVGSCGGVLNTPRFWS